jgi:hypothetical protein
MQALKRAHELGGASGAYARQAAIIACHAQARTADETDWSRISELYADLATIFPSPIVELNRAVAVGWAVGPEAALAIIDRLKSEPALERYHLLPSIRGDLLRKLRAIAPRLTSREDVSGSDGFGVRMGKRTELLFLTLRGERDVLARGPYLGSQLENFGAGDSVDLHNFSASGATFAYNSSSGLLQLSSGGALATIDFQQSTLGGGSFHLAADASGSGLLVTRA